MSQEDVCKLWVALYPIFTDAYMNISIPEKGLLVNDLSRIELITECLAKWLPFLEQENP